MFATRQRRLWQTVHCGRDRLEVRNLIITRERESEREVEESLDYVASSYQPTKVKQWGPAHTHSYRPTLNVLTVKLNWFTASLQSMFDPDVLAWTRTRKFLSSRIGCLEYRAHRWCLRNFLLNIKYFIGLPLCIIVLLHNINGVFSTQFWRKAKRFEFLDLVHERLSRT